MKIDTEKEINNIETLLNSIQNDEKTLHWFAFLFENKNVREKLETDENFPKKLTEYKSINLKINITNATLAILLISIIFFKLYISIIPLSLLLILSQHQLKKKGICLARIFPEFLQNEFNENELKHKTLYQICEILSKKYNVFSLVDTIFIYDNLAFKIFILFVFLFNTLLTRFSILHCIIAIVASFKLFKIIQEIPWVYKRLYKPKNRHQ